MNVTLKPARKSLLNKDSVDEILEFNWGSNPDEEVERQSFPNPLPD